MSVGFGKVSSRLYASYVSSPSTAEDGAYAQVLYVCLQEQVQQQHMSQQQAVQVNPYLAGRSVNPVQVCDLLLASYPSMQIPCLEPVPMCVLQTKLRATTQLWCNKRK